MPSSSSRIAIAIRDRLPCFVMIAFRSPSLLLIALLAAPLLIGCGGDDDDEAEQAVCDDAFEAFCACPAVSCSGHPESCTGPDREWAECINAAPDPCTASCD